jgi:DNA-binding NtrC family response regulator
MNLIPNPNPTARLAIELDGQQFFIVTKNLVENYIRFIEQERRAANSTKTCSKTEALEILGCSESTFYRLLKKPGCEIRRAAAKGTFILSTVYAQLKN